MDAILMGLVKRKLNITWSDEETDARLEEIIESAIPVLKFKLGMADSEDFDFGVAGQERNLFLSYCLYEWNHVTNEFDDNYANEIAQIRSKNDVKHYREVVDNEETV